MDLYLPASLLPRLLTTYERTSKGFYVFAPEHELNFGENLNADPGISGFYPRGGMHRPGDGESLADKKRAVVPSGPFARQLYDAKR
jgi:hypothetical protein